MKILDLYIKTQKEIYEYFGYVESWRVFPIDDKREYFWKIIGSEKYGGSIGFAKTIEIIHSETGEYYEDGIYIQDHIKKGVLRGEKYTMICVDTQVDMNVFLMIFDNEKEIKGGVDER